jgi:hypothetical protein
MSLAFDRKSGRLSALSTRSSDALNKIPGLFAPEYIPG